MTSGEGTIEIDLVDFWSFVAKHHDHKSAEIFYGVPRVNINNSVIEIDYAYCTDGTPEQWKEEPKSVQQWKQLKKESTK